MRISDWSSDVCSSDLSFGNYSDLSLEGAISGPIVGDKLLARVSAKMQERDGHGTNATTGKDVDDLKTRAVRAILDFRPSDGISFLLDGDRSEEHTSELQSLMRISYAVFCLKH